MYKYICWLFVFPPEGWNVNQKACKSIRLLIQVDLIWPAFFFFLPFLITENATGNMYPPLYLILPAGTVCVPTSAVSHHLQFNVMYLPQLWTNRNTVTLLRLHQRRLWLCCIALHGERKKSKLILFMIYYDTLNNTSSKTMTLLWGCDDWNWFCMCWNAFVMDYIRLGGCLW